MPPEFIFLTCVQMWNTIVFPSHFKRPLSLFIEYFFHVLVQKSSVMSDSLLSLLLEEQPLEKDERKRREEKRPFCYFVSSDLLHRLFRPVDELLQKVY